MRGVWQYELFGIFLVLLFSLLFAAWECAFRRKVNRRAPMDDDAFFEAFYAGTRIPADIPQRLRPIYAQFFRIDPLKLRPTDWPPEIPDVDTSELVTEVEREFAVSIRDADLEHIDGSFDSIVQYLAAQRGIQRHD